MNFVNDSNHLDQHFLTDPEVVNQLIETGAFTRQDIVVEVGPGNGVLTQRIAHLVSKLTVIELDDRLKSFLESLQVTYPNIEIKMGNVLNTYIPSCDKIIASLPYSIVEPFMMKLVKCTFKESILITGQRYAYNVLHKEITKLGYLTNAFFNVTKIIDIPPESFNPKPRVMSCMIKLVPLQEKEIKDSKIIFWRHMFYMKEKKLRNALTESMITMAKFKGFTLTQKESKQKVDAMNLPTSLLEKTFQVCSNDELKVVVNQLEEGNF